MRSFFLSVAMALIAGGCADGDIATVKGGVMDFNKTTTLGQALDAWASCGKSEWKSFETANGTRVVEFYCEHKNVSAYGANLKRLILESQVNAMAALSMQPQLAMLQPALEIDPGVLDIVAYKQRFQFTLNSDDTFQVDNVEGTLEWGDGTSSDDKLKDPLPVLSFAYKTTYGWEVDQYAPVVIMGAKPNRDYDNRLTAAAAFGVASEVIGRRFLAKGIDFQAAMLAHMAGKLGGKKANEPPTARQDEDGPGSAATPETSEPPAGRVPDEPTQEVVGRGEAPREGTIPDDVPNAAPAPEPDTAFQEPQFYANEEEAEMAGEKPEPPTPPADAKPSFDCARASHFVEKTICQDTELSWLDSRVASAYAEVRSLSREPDRIKSEQLAWLNVTRRCTDKPCLLAAYRQRVIELE